MKYKALVSFCGSLSMHKGEVRELTDEQSVDLLRCHYIEPIKAKEKPAKAEKAK